MKNFSAAKKEALARAQIGRRKAARAARAELIAPAGWRSARELLDAARGVTDSELGSKERLAQYLGTNRKSLWRWLTHEQWPEQRTIDALASWMRRRDGI